MGPFSSIVKTFLVYSSQCLSLWYSSLCCQVQDPDVVGLTVEETFNSQNNVVSRLYLAFFASLNMMLVYVYDVWFDELQIQRLSRVDSDFSGFLHHAGIPSIDMYYGAGKYSDYLKNMFRNQNVKF